MHDSDLVTILGRCLTKGDTADWELFISLAQPIVASGVLRTLSDTARADRALVDDLIQETFVRLCAADFRVLRRFRGADPNALAVYLKTIAASIAIDYFRSQSAQKKGSGTPPASLDAIASRLGKDDARFAEFERKLLLEHVDKCLETQEPRNRTIFWLYHRQGLTPKAISALPGVGLAADGVETAIYRLTKAVRDCLQRAGILQPASRPEGGRA
jgi:RNA polymerase sigma factor (sigma-70 family)